MYVQRLHNIQVQIVFTKEKPRSNESTRGANAPVLKAFGIGLGAYCDLTKELDTDF